MTIDLNTPDPSSTPPKNFYRTPDYTVEWGFESEKPMAWLRAIRDMKLKETDWTQNSDVPTTTKDKWASYRQALRDLPANTSNPTFVRGELEGVTWPTKPS